MDNSAVDQPSGGGSVHRLVDRYHAIAPVIDRITMAIAGVLVVIAVATTAAAVVARRFPAFPSVPWAAEATTICVITAVLLVVPQGLRHDSHLAVTMLTERVGQRSFRVITAINQILCMSFFIVLVWFGIEMAALQQQANTPMLGISLLWPYLVIAVAGILMFVEALVRLTEAVLNRAPRPHGVQDDTAGRPPTQYEGA